MEGRGMPLETEIRRNGKPLKLRWSGFHVTAMVMAAAFDSGEGPFQGKQEPGKYRYNDDAPEYAGMTNEDYPGAPCPINPGDSWLLCSYPYIAMTPLNKGKYTLKETHRFLDTTDGEVLELLPGDELRAWRVSK